MTTTTPNTVGVAKRLFLLLSAPIRVPARTLRWLYRVTPLLSTLTGVILGGTVIVGAALYAAGMPPSLKGDRETLLWSVSLVGLMLAGMLMGLVGRRVPIMESALMVCILGALCWVQLQYGWPHAVQRGLSTFLALGLVGDTVTGWAEVVLSHLQQGEDEVYLQFVAGIPLGVRVFGEMWSRFLAVALVGGFFLSVLGGSIAFLFFGDERRFDRRFTYEWHIARKHLRGADALIGSTAFVAIAGVALGVAALVSVTAVMSGYQRDVQDKILSTNAHLVVQKYGIDFTEYEEVAKKGMAVDGIVASTPFAFNTAMLSGGDLGLGVLLKGIIPETAGDVTDVNRNVCLPTTPGKPCVHVSQDPVEATAALVAGVQANDGMPRLLLGHSLFDKLGLPIGSEVVLTTAVGIAGAHGNAPKRMHFRIGGSFRSGMHEFDARLVYLHLSAAQKLMGLGEAVNGIEFRVNDPDQVTGIAKEVLGAVGRYPYRTLDWHDLNSSIFTALRLQKIVMFLVLCFIVVVAAFNIASTLFMAAVEKAHEIGVLKSMGASNSSIMKIFVLEGWAVGGVGTVLGVILGLLVCFALSQLQLSIAGDVYMVSTLKVWVNPSEVLATVASALAISHLATLYPALAAARRRPVDAMRFA